MSKARRARGQGTIVYLKKRKEYMVQVPIRGTRVTRYTDTIEEAELVRRELVLMRETGQVPTTDTLADVMDEWLDSVEWAPSTRKRYEQVVRLYLKPHLGKRQASLLTPEDVSKFMTRLRQDNIGPRQRQYCHKALRACYSWQLELMRVPDNPVERVRPPKYHAPEKKPLTPLEVDRFLRAAYAEPAGLGSRCGALWALMIVHGLRMGEALGLSWENVDLHNAVIYIREQLSPDKTLAPLKTPSSYRDIPLRPRVADALTAVWESQGRPLSGLVFRTGDGEPQNRRDVAVYLERFLRRNGIRRITPHGLRHTAASIMARDRVAPRTIMELMGHKDLNETLRIYTHSDLDLKRDATRIFDDLLSD